MVAKAQGGWFKRRSLFGKYVASSMGLVAFVLAMSGATDVWFTYRDTKANLLAAQSEKADSAALRVEQFFAELERQMRWEGRPSPIDPQQRRIDFQLVLDHVPAVASLTQFDAGGAETYGLSRAGGPAPARAFDVPALKSATEGAWVGPVRFGASGPHIEVAVPQAGDRGLVTVADVELRYLSDILNGIQAGPGVSAFIAAKGRLIAHTNSAMVSRNLDLTRLPQVRAADLRDASPVGVGENLDGAAVLSAFASVPKLNWSVFVEQPLAAAYTPVYALLFRLAWMFVLAMGLCFLASSLLARRMTVPITALQRGAARIAAGDFTHAIEVRSGDEVEALAYEFNLMANRLRQSYGQLEIEVEDRTRDLARSIRELKALEDVGHAVAESLDLRNVLATIVTSAVELAGAEGGAIYSFDAERRAFTLAEAHGLDPDFVAAIREVLIRRFDGPLADVMEKRQPIQVPEIAETKEFPLRAATLAAGFRSALIVPLVAADAVLGALIVERRRPGLLPSGTVDLMQAFAHQSALAMKNAQLFRQVEHKGKELAVANDHQSRFFANMSHELRTPLNAVLGYAELLGDGLYGALPEKAKGILDRIQSNGRHLLGLINDILDLSKLEAGELALTLENYIMRDVIETVVGATGSLAERKGLYLKANIEPDLPLGRGDERRLNQVLMNLVSNAIKFTDTGGVTVSARLAGDSFELTVEDTGPGIAPEDQARIFQPFQQVDDTATRLKGGTGLGLSISRRFVEMHGGAISVSSTLGSGSAFRVILPIRADAQKVAA